jgi:hypothetical protein
MASPKDIVWNTITESAKTRFDYASFESGFSNFDDGTMAANVLFLTIIGHSQERPIDAIVSDISQKFLLLGLGIDEGGLREFVANRHTDLAREIMAVKFALALFDVPTEPSSVLVQIQNILER